MRGVVGFQGETFFVKFSRRRESVFLGIRLRVRSVSHAGDGKLFRRYYAGGFDGDKLVRKVRAR